MRVQVYSCEHTYEYVYEHTYKLVIVRLRIFGLRFGWTQLQDGARRSGHKFTARAIIYNNYSYIIIVATRDYYLEYTRGVVPGRRVASRRVATPRPLYSRTAIKTNRH